MGTRRVSILALAAASVLAVAAPAHADDRVIAAGVSAGGVDLGGLTVDAAAAKLQSVLTPHLSRDVVVGAGGVAYRLPTADAKLAFDALRTAQRAAHVPPADAATPPPAAGGTTAGVVVPLALSHSRLAVRAWVKQVAAKVYRAPRNATLRITLAHLTMRRATVGASLDQQATAAAVDAALDDGAASRVLHQKLVRVRPRVNANDLRARYRTVLTVDRAHFTLRLFKDLKLSKRYGIAVGRAGLDTPAGLYAIHDKQVNPAWHVPNSAWAGALAGHVIPGGAPNNPLVARWLGIANGIGIHGTDEPWSIGSAASHGCIRMRPADVIDLFPRVPVGSTVLIK
jgi:lipoprotein-anchoring transpeptidase ErfK/SrfK